MLEVKEVPFLWLRGAAKQVIAHRPFGGSVDLVHFRRPERSICLAATQSFVLRKPACSLAKASFRGPKD